MKLRRNGFKRARRREPAAAEREPTWCTGGRAQTGWAEVLQSRERFGAGAEVSKEASCGNSGETIARKKRARGTAEIHGGDTGDRDAFRSGGREALVERSAADPVTDSPLLGRPGGESCGRSRERHGANSAHQIALAWALADRRDHPDPRHSSLAARERAADQPDGRLCWAAGSSRRPGGQADQGWAGWREQGLTGDLG